MQPEGTRPLGHRERSQGYPLGRDLCGWHYVLLDNRRRREKLTRYRDRLGMAVTPRADTVSSDPRPVTPPAHEAPVTPTRVCPRCGAGRMVVVAEFPPTAPAGGIRSGLEPCLIFDSS